MRRVLLLSTTTGYQLRSFDEAARQLNIELVFATDRCHQLDDPWRDRAVAVRFHEESASIETIAAEHARAPFRGILSVGDRPTILAARAANLLGLPGNSPDAAAASGNKAVTRERFAAAGLNVPWHVTLPIDGAAKPATPIAFPCVLKPLGLSGSRGVIRANTQAEFDAAFDRIARLLDRPEVRAARTGLDDVILVEGFIAGRELALDGVLTRGRLQVFAIFDKPDPLDGPFFEETIYVTPPPLEPAVEADLLRTIERACAALGLRHGPIHAEFRMGTDGLFVLEVAARPIGGLCSRAIRLVDAAGSASAPRSLEEILLRHAVGEDISAWVREPMASAVMMIPIPRRGILKRTHGEEAARAVPHVDDVRITARPDQLLEPLPEAGSYLGFVFARAESAEGAERAVREAHRQLSFTIDAAIDVAAG